jgi:hypothetical protein
MNSEKPKQKVRNSDESILVHLLGEDKIERVLAFFPAFSVSPCLCGYLNRRF